MCNLRTQRWNDQFFAAARPTDELVARITVRMAGTPQEMAATGLGPIPGTKKGRHITHKHVRWCIPFKHPTKNTAQVANLICYLVVRRRSYDLTHSHIAELQCAAKIREAPDSAGDGRRLDLQFRKEATDSNQARC